MLQHNETCLGSGDPLSWPSPRHGSIWSRGAVASIDEGEFRRCEIGDGDAGRRLGECAWRHAGGGRGVGPTAPYPGGKAAAFGYPFHALLGHAKTLVETGVCMFDCRFALQRALTTSLPHGHTRVPESFWVVYKQAKAALKSGEAADPWF